MRAAVFAALFALLTACAPATAPTPDFAADEAAIRQVMDRQAAAWNAGDIDGFMGGYWNSPKLTFISGTDVTRGWTPTLTRYKARYSDRAKMGRLAFTDLEVTPLGPDAALVIGKWRLTREKDQPNGVFSLTWRRIDGRWVVIVDHTS